MDLVSLWRLLQVVLGIGLVIFVHEAGHYMAARLCGVRVHVFSLGFGPRLFGWRRGGTDYQVAVVPLGGYVRMAGEETHYSDQPSAPDELGSKSVGQRFFIYSAGVIMNVVFGLVVFPVLFLVGVPSVEPVLGQVEPGSPAWVAGLQPGDRLLEVNEEPIHDLTQVLPEVAYGGREPARVLVQRPGVEAPFLVEVPPEFDEGFEIYSIGNLAPAFAEGLPLTVREGGAAQAAGVRDGDRLLGVVGASEALDPARQLSRAVAAEEPFAVRVGRDAEELILELEPAPGPETPPRVGFVSPFRLVKGVRGGAVTASLGVRAGDRLLEVDGHPIQDPGDLVGALLATREATAWTVLRDGARVELVGPGLSEAEAVALADDLALTYDRDSTAVHVLVGSPAWRAGLRSGDLVEEVDDAEVAVYDDLVEASRRAAAEGRPMRMEVVREDAEGGREFLEVVVTPEPIPTVDFGLALPLATYDYRISNPVEAVRVGAVASYKMIVDVARHLRGMLRREVGKQNVGSIIKIGIVAHQTAEIGWVKFFWFLCLLSMNLAFLNVLPIPILDGGHLFFLLVEKLKGSPVSETLFSYSQLVGLVLIVSIFVFVLYNDLTQHVF
jgi:regulator of sigma E protease